MMSGVVTLCDICGCSLVQYYHATMLLKSLLKEEEASKTVVCLGVMYTDLFCCISSTDRTGIKMEAPSNS